MKHCEGSYTSEYNMATIKSAIIYTALFFGYDLSIDYNKVIDSMKSPVVIVGINPTILHDASETGASFITSGVVLMDADGFILTIYDCHTAVDIGHRSVGDTIK